MTVYAPMSYIEMPRAFPGIWSMIAHIPITETDGLAARERHFQIRRGVGRAGFDPADHLCRRHGQAKRSPAQPGAPPGPR